MQQGLAQPTVKDVVLVGAGHAHVTVLRAFGMKPIPGVRFTLITREVHTPYSGMLPGLIAGLYDYDEAHIDTGPLSRFAGARLYHDEVVGIDLAAQRVICRNRPPVCYDLVSLDPGSTPNTALVAGAREHAIPVKPIAGFLERFEALKARVLARKDQVRIALVGGGAGGVELLLSVERRLRRELAQAGCDPASISYTLVTKSPDILPTFPRAFRARFRKVLRERGIAVFAGAAVTRVEAGRLFFDGTAPLDVDEILWTTEAAPPPWFGESGFSVDANGFLEVDATLRAVGQSNVFGAGDAIAFCPRALPKSGVYAVRAGPVLADNIRRALIGRALRPFRPQHEALYLVSTGERYAIGTRNGISFEGGWAWRWKDWIDRRFMRKFNELPEMKEPRRGLLFTSRGPGSVT
jgi:selenide,water dikinase